ncbi:hypothetical protein V6N11_003315 [Hibiscus sabdariffa]|uniref:Uncharacterized protein n=1 Tax=Hibiscus sabdariffa TaxID=183260 RepID=A0ABR2SD48_9ROSI
MKAISMKYRENVAYGKDDGLGIFHGSKRVNKGAKGNCIIIVHGTLPVRLVPMGIPTVFYHQLGGYYFQENTCNFWRCSQAVILSEFWRHNTK